MAVVSNNHYVIWHQPGSLKEVPKPELTKDVAVHALPRSIMLVVHIHGLDVLAYGSRTVIWPWTWAEAFPRASRLWFKPSHPS